MTTPSPPPPLAVPPDPAPAAPAPTTTGAWVGLGLVVYGCGSALVSFIGLAMADVIPAGQELTLGEMQAEAGGAGVPGKIEELFEEMADAQEIALEAATIDNGASLALAVLLVVCGLGILFRRESSRRLVQPVLLLKILLLVGVMVHVVGWQMPAYGAMLETLEEFASTQGGGQEFQFVRMFETFGTLSVVMSVVFSLLPAALCLWFVRMRSTREWCGSAVETGSGSG